MGATCRTATDVGRRRDHNEDAYLVDEALQLYIVADGMGGHACGEVASGLAVQAFQDFVHERCDVVWGFRDGSPSIPCWMVRRLLEDALHAACREVWRKAQETPEMRGMGTTLVALLVAGERGFIAHVGDSRAYLVREGQSVQLTRDHSVLNELLRRGEITEASANSTYAGFKHALSRAVGVCEDVEVDTTDFEILPGDVFLLASDGLTGYVKGEELPPLVDTLPHDALPGALVATANDRGGEDNITAVVVRVEPDAMDVAGDEQRSREFATKITAFRALPLFRHLDYGEMIRVLSVTDVAVMPQGEVVLREGQEGDAMYVVLSGRVVLDKQGARIAEFEGGAHFGEVSLVDKAPRSATATVVEEARLLRLKREHLYAFVQREPEIAVKLLWSFAETLGERLRTTTAGFADLQAIVGAGATERA
jgi:serine/threonine protein phosphatase PrpC